MADKLKNIIESIASEFLDQTLALRYDICTCPTCKNDILAHVLSRVPAKYVTTDKGALHTIIENTRIENQAEIGKAILNAIEAISGNPHHEIIEDRDQAFKLLLEKIHTDRGVDFRHYRSELLKRRVSLRIRANNLKSYSEYLRILVKNNEEYEKLFEVLCINVSEFFRDAEVWITIKYLIENLLRQKMRSGDKTLRIWSAGCSDGEEPYSLAIILKELLKDDLKHMYVKIYATDLDKKCIKNLGKAEYSKENIKNVEKAYLEKYFIPLKDNVYRLKQEIKELVECRLLDLTSEDLITDTDLVLCRNVFIYFSRSLQEQILMKFYNSLKPKGYLILGKAELILSEARQVFDEIDLNARIYQKST